MGSPPGTTAPPAPGEPPPAEAQKPPESAKPTPLTAKDIVLPEGAQGADEPTKEALVSILNKYNVPRAGLEELVNLQIEVMKAASDRTSGLWRETQETWRREISADSQYGGPRLQSNLGQISRLIDGCASNATKLREAFDLTGFGNHPEAIKFFANICRKYLSEGEAVQGQPSATGRTQAEILFPNQGKT
jgi:hypothetical protein